MAKLVISNNGKDLGEFVIDGAVVRIGRREDNDLVLKDSTVSGHHAVLELGGEARLEDAGSTNGTYVNGRRVAGSLGIKDGDTIRIGQHELRFVERDSPDHDSTVIIPPSSAPPGRVKVTSGSRKGEVIELTRPHTTLGKAGEQVAVIARRGRDYVLLPVTTEAGQTPLLNGSPIGAESVPLKSGDVIEVAGMRVSFL